MPPRKTAPVAPTIEPKIFSNDDEIDRAITKLQRRVKDIAEINVPDTVVSHTGALEAARSNLRNTILEIYGPNSLEYREHEHIDFWAGPMFINMDEHQIVEGTQHGVTQTIGIVNGLIDRLREKREDLEAGDKPTPSTYFDKLNLHPRIADVCRDNVLRRKSPQRLIFTSVDRLVFAGLYRLAPGVLDALKIVRPETVIRWHRASFRAYWRWKSRPRSGRPKTPLEIRQLIREISLANPLWGAPRLHGELLKLGIDVGQTTVAKYMARGRRPPSQGWKKVFPSIVMVPNVVRSISMT